MVFAAGWGPIRNKAHEACRLAARATVMHPGTCAREQSRQPISPLAPSAVRSRNVHRHEAHQPPQAGADEQHGHKDAGGDGAAGCRVLGGGGNRGE